MPVEHDRSAWVGRSWPAWLAAVPGAYQPETFDNSDAARFRWQALEYGGAAKLARTAYSRREKGRISAVGLDSVDIADLWYYGHIDQSSSRGFARISRVCRRAHRWSRSTTFLSSA